MFFKFMFFHIMNELPYITLDWNIISISILIPFCCLSKSWPISYWLLSLLNIPHFLQRLISFPKNLINLHNFLIIIIIILRCKLIINIGLNTYMVWPLRPLIKCRFWFLNKYLLSHIISIYQTSRRRVNFLFFRPTMNLFRSIGLFFIIALSIIVKSCISYI